MIVLELQFPAVQPGDGGSEAQPQSRARLRAALRKMHEALDDAAAIGFGDARAAVGDAQGDAVTLGAGLDQSRPECRSIYHSGRHI